VGAVWRRWDPHLHAPGTLLADRFKGDWNAYLNAIETSTPRIEVVGVTDYFCIRTYKSVLNWKEQGRLKDVLVFPNVELRLDVKTDKAAINLHLMFSPDDAKHVDAIERILSLFTCTYDGRVWKCSESDLVSIGHLIEPRADTEAALRLGAGQFKVSLSDLRALFRDDAWFQRNCLFAVAGSRNDGTSGLQSDDSFTLLRREIEQFADIIFASTPKQREFWLGRGTDDAAKLERIYRGTKPCLHGSDAHALESVGNPPLDRYCWIKGEPTFESLRQAVIEPEDRVWVGDRPPDRSVSERIATLQVSDAAWLGTADMELNDGLVAIIGERGSGKTALADMIARAAKAPGAGTAEASFLKRAAPLLSNETVTLNWRGGSVSAPRSLCPDPWDDDHDHDAEVRYLSQQFVDGLCSAAGLATRLREEIERVVFDASEESRRMGASSFEEMADIWLEPIRRRREELRDLIHASAASIEEEDQRRASLAGLNADRTELAKKLSLERENLGKLVPPGQEERAKLLLAVEADYSKVEGIVERLRRERKRVDDLKAEIKHVRSNVEPARLSKMQSTFAAAGLSAADWNAFTMDFVGDVDAILSKRGDDLDVHIKRAIDGDPSAPGIYATDGAVDRAFLKEIQARRDELRKAVGIDAQAKRTYERLSAQIQQMEAALRRLDASIQLATGADSRRTHLIAARRQHYLDVFTTFVEEERMLAELYAPLAKNLAGAVGAASKLRLVVRRNIDLNAWVMAGEELLDLRASTQFRGRGALRSMAERQLLPAWLNGAAKDVADAMDSFRTTVQEDIRNALPARLTTTEERRAWTQEVATWLYSTAHVSIVYRLTYDGVAIEQLSPGTRGIVLLLLFLVVDRSDHRPLIVDQPEENLDPKSVFDELVPHFRQARKHRQVIIVTHNANLVVNTDADQVIVAESQPAGDGGLPTITYWAGSLETKDIRSAVCATLEGGERAFLEREKRYRINRPDVVVVRDAVRNNG
jgi:ABC-type lipoprotein export system ATPase subunit